MKITADLLKKYFNEEKKYQYYTEAVEAAEALRIHANGDYPQKLIEERRPSESEFIHGYRKKIWKAITKPPLSKVISELGKIRKADDWSIRYDVNTFPATIKKGETLQDYCETKLPYFTSLTNWTFTVLLRSYLLESNSVILTIPLNTEETASVYRKPFPFWFPTENVFEFIEDELCILKSRDKSKYTENGNDYLDGDIFYVVDNEMVIKYEQVNSKRDFNPTVSFIHGLGYMPAFKCKGLFLKSQEKYFLYESRIAAMLPNLDEAVREYSDLQAEVVQHIHSEKWVLDTQNCQVCNGTTKIRQGNPPEVVTCPQCKGSGSVATSPYLNIVIKRAKIGEQQWTGDPAGYIEKQLGIVEIQDKRVDKHIYKALSAINMEFLADVPLAESGVSKEVDMDALNNFVNAVAEDIVAIMDTIVRMINDYRYKDIVIDPEKRKLMLPKIAVPTKLNILSVNFIVDEVKKLKDGNVNPIIVNASEIELANKKFANDPDVRDRLVCVYELDPLSGLSQDDKMSMLQNKGITLEDYVISCNIQRLVKMAFVANSKFASLDFNTKVAIIKALAMPLILVLNPVIDLTAAPPPDVTSHDVGKVPLALQQLALAKMRAEEGGDTQLAKSISKKMTELLENI